jgi:hypothetical protein
LQQPAFKGYKQKATHDRSEGGLPLDLVFDLEKLHNQGARGQGIKVAIFDSGLGEEYQTDSEKRDRLNIAKIYDFTKEKVRDEFRSNLAVADID